MVALVVLCLFIPQWSPAATLSEYYESAILNTATIKDRMLAVEIAKAEKSQAIGSVLPEVSANSENTWRDQVDVGPFGEGYQHSAFLNLTQPIFQGGSEYFAIGVAQTRPKIAALQQRQEQLALYNRVAQAFFDLLRIQKDGETLDQQKQTLAEQVKTLRGRAKIGQNKQTDVLAAQAQLARVTADESRLSRDRQAAQIRLHNLTGKAADTVLIDELPLSSLTVPPRWKSQIIDSPTIAATELELKAAEKSIGVERGRFLPSVDLGANYYLDRAGILQDSTWDVAVNVRWNIYAGGKDLAQKRIASLQMTQIENRLSDLKRTIKNDFSSLEKQLALQKETIEKLKLALSLAKKNYQEYKKEVNRGLITQLEVLRILEDQIQIQREYNQEVLYAKLLWIQMKVLAGELL